MGKPFFVPTNSVKGNIAATIFKGDTECDSATLDLQAAVTDFNSALILFSASIGAQTLEKVGCISEKVDRINETAEGKIFYTKNKFTVLTLFRDSSRLLNFAGSKDS